MKALLFSLLLLILSAVHSFFHIMYRENSIGSRVSQRKRGFLSHPPSVEAPPSPPKSRRKLNTKEYTDNDVSIIKETYGDYQHHGTGNPLNQRAPSAPREMALTNLAAIIQNGSVGQESSNSTPQLKTERGNKGSFWTCRLRHAGQYGWTGLVLPQNAKSDQPFPIEHVSYFLLESASQVAKLKSQVSDLKWNEVKERVITVSQLAELAKRSACSSTD
jgi:hypothetical protein